MRSRSGEVRSGQIGHEKRTCQVRPGGGGVDPANKDESPQPPYSLGFFPGGNSSWRFGGVDRNDKGLKRDQSGSQGSIRMQKS